MKYNFQSYFGDNRIEAMNKPVFLLEVYNAGGSGKYGKISVRPVFLHNGTYEFYDNRSEAGSILHWFMCDAQFDWMSGEEPYAIRTGYRDDDVFTIENIDTVTERFAFLKRVTKALWKTFGTLGRPRTFAQYVLRLASVMGIKEIIVRTSGTHVYPYEYRYLNIEDFESTVENTLKTGRLS